MDWYKVVAIYVGPDLQNHQKFQTNSYTNWYRSDLPDLNEFLLIIELFLEEHSDQGPHWLLQRCFKRTSRRQFSCNQLLKS